MCTELELIYGQLSCLGSIVSVAMLISASTLPLITSSLDYCDFAVHEGKESIRAVYFLGFS